MSTPLLSVAIMAHPKREHFVRDLEQRLPGAIVVWDEKDDRWDTGRRAMEAFSPWSRHHLVVQDDALLCNNFLRGVEQAIAFVLDDEPASFYIGRSRPHGPAVARAVRRATLAGRHWLRMRGPIWGPAIAMPTERIPEVVEGADAYDIDNYDTRMMAYLEATGTKCWYTIPTLVDHRVGSENPSLVPGRGNSSARTAHAFIRDGDPTNVDWSTRPYEVERIEDMWWDSPQGKQCSMCKHFSPDVLHAVEHAAGHFWGGGNGTRVATYSRDPERQGELDALWRQLPHTIRGGSPALDDGEERPWLVLVWDEDDVHAAGEYPVLAIEPQKQWAEFASALGSTGISMKVLS